VDGVEDVTTRDDVGHGQTVGGDESRQQEKSDLFTMRKRNIIRRSITRPFASPGGNPVKVAFENPKTSRNLV
jgi:hypothetical protein